MTSLTAWLTRERDACFSMANQHGPNRTYWIERGYYFTLALDITVRLRPPRRPLRALLKPTKK